ncbi:uroporphyrinogen III methyltransferase [Gemmatimonadetes bacterium T265]|nr:uroporphyrinogen III methyltransferase [Gemmatimonadetes bacterium T265]
MPAGASPGDAPLAGRTVAITRPRERAHGLIAALEALGATVLSAPAIAVAPPATYDALDAALHRLAAPAAPEHAYHWLLLTSAAAVDVVAARLDALGLALADETTTRVGVVGAATAGAAQARLGRVDVIPSLHTADGLAAALPSLWGARVLFPCADRARDALPTVLAARGAQVHRVIAYRTVDAPPDALSDVAGRAAAGTLDLVVVASPSAAGALVRAFAAAGLPPAACDAVCIGPTTAEACRGHGLRVAAVAPEPTDDALVRVTLTCLTSGRHPLPAR